MFEETRTKVFIWVQVQYNCFYTLNQYEQVVSKRDLRPTFLLKYSNYKINNKTVYGNVTFLYKLANVEQNYFFPCSVTRSTLHFRQVSQSVSQTSYFSRTLAVADNRALSSTMLPVAAKYSMLPLFPLVHPPYFLQVSQSWFIFSWAIWGPTVWVSSIRPLVIQKLTELGYVCKVIYFHPEFLPSRLRTLHKWIRLDFILGNLTLLCLRMTASSIQRTGE